MGALRARFWQLPLDQLTRAEWEALCDGCGRCCLHKIEDADTGDIQDTNVACRLLDPATARCRNYPNRRAHVPDCLQLTPELLLEIGWLPSTCAYRLRAAGRPLYSWHPLLSGDPEGPIAAGVSAAGRIISEDEAGPLEHHLVEWDETDG